MYGCLCFDASVVRQHLQTKVFEVMDSFSIPFIVLYLCVVCALADHCLDFRGIKLMICFISEFDCSNKLHLNSVEAVFSKNYFISEIEIIHTCC